MRSTRLIMGMPITVEVVDAADASAPQTVFDYFTSVDARFSPFKPDSEVSALNRGEVSLAQISAALREVFDLAELTRNETHGYFDIRRPDGRIDPSGLVKGWAIRNAARLLDRAGCSDYCVEAGGDIQCRGRSASGNPWRVGIRDPFNDGQIVKIFVPGDRGVATSGLYVRGAHIYDPLRGQSAIGDIASMTVIGPDIYDADRFATAAFAMGRDGIGFIEDTWGLEGYVIDATGIATMTSGFNGMVVQ
jgi:thiamine biosynthesis lipoprotein